MSDGWHLLLFPGYRNRLVRLARGLLLKVAGRVHLLLLLLGRRRHWEPRRLLEVTQLLLCRLGVSLQLGCWRRRPLQLNIALLRSSRQAPLVLLLPLLRCR